MYNNNPTDFRIQRGEQRGQIVLVCINLMILIMILSWSHNPLLVAKGNVGAKAQGMSQYFPLKEALRHHVGKVAQCSLDMMRSKGHEPTMGRWNHQPESPD